MELYSILLPLALIMIISKILMKLCGRIRIPGVVGMLLTGILIGLINYVPDQTLLTPLGREGISIFAKVGVVLLLFSAGLETDLYKIKRIGGRVVLITIAGIVVPLALGFLVATLCNGGFGALSTGNIIKNLFYGTILTATSVSVSVATLREAGKLDTKVGATVVAAAIIDDILGIIVLSLVLALSDNAAASPLTVILQVLVYFVVIAVIAFFADKLFRFLDKKYPHHRLIPIFGIALCFLVAYASEKWFGVADIIGAYIVGLTLSINHEKEYINRKADILEYMIFVPVFFANIGISLKPDGFDTRMIVFGLLFVVAGLLGKLVGCGVTAACCGYSLRDSFRVGVAMMVRAEVALVTAQKGVEYGLVDASIMPFIVLLIIVTSLIAPIILQKSFQKEAGLLNVQ
ncbi:MAG: cation:proton antiporter [Clostridiales bacterium]|nr:cation:proton antiporter [Clostridiales bacterium]